MYKIKRIVVTGTPGAGKTTFIRTISEIKTVDTDKEATDGTRLLKPKTTVGMDFGRIQLASKVAIHLYGTPGQSRFDFMWDVLIGSAEAYILLVAANRPQEFSKARQMIEFMNQRVKVPMIVGVTHMDCPGASGHNRIAIAMGYLDSIKRPPFVTVNANEPLSVKRALNVVLQQLMTTKKERIASQYCSVS